MADNNPHIFLNNIAVSYDFQPRQGFGSDKIPVRNRNQHSNKLLQEFTNTESAIQQTKQERIQNQLPFKSGSYWEFSGRAGYSLVTKSLENLPKNIRLLNIKTEGDTPDNTTIKAVVYVPENEEKIFRKKITDYKFKNTKAENPKNANLVNSIESISLASVLSLWTDNPSLIPNENKAWCEVWLYTGKNAGEINAEIQRSCELIDIQLSSQQLAFPERMVRLIRANRAQLMELIEQCDFIAEMGSI